MALGGIETMLVNIANEQVNRGHDVGIIVLWNQINSTLVKRIDTRVKLYFINKPQRSISPYYYLKLNKLFTTLKYDILHVHSAKLSDFIWIPSARRKMCLTQHRNCNGEGINRIKNYDYIFAISECVRKDIKYNWGLDSTVVYNGIQPTLFKKGLQKHSEKDGHFHIIQLGRLYHQDKGQHILLNAVSILNAKGYRNIKVDFIGDGPSREFLIGLSVELGIQDMVEFVGPQSQEYIYANLCRYDLEVQPSLFEGFGLTVAEAMAVNLPVLVADNMGPMEVIENGRCGYVFKYGDYNDCAQKIIDILENGIDKSKVERAHDRVLQKFNVTNTASLYIQHYENIMNKSASQQYTKIITRRQLKEWVAADYLRSGMKHPVVARLTFGEHDITRRYLKTLRHLEYYLNNKNRNILFRIMYYIYLMLHRRNCVKKGIYIMPNTCGKGLSLPHPGFIRVDSFCQLGENCTILPMVLLGKKTSGIDGTIRIGNNCYISTGVTILGPVNIGDNVTIGAGAVVTRDIQDNCIVGGVPAKIIKQK